MYSNEGHARNTAIETLNDILFYPTIDVYFVYVFSYVLFNMASLDVRLCDIVNTE